MLRGAGLELSHVDLTIVAQTPRLSPFREEIRKNVARLLGLDTARVNLKATTEEGLGFTGRSEGIKAYAVVSALAGRHAVLFRTGCSIPRPLISIRMRHEH